MAIINLYPGVVETYMPAFVIENSTDDKCRVYFSISTYNSKKNIANVQVTVVNQYTDKSCLNKSTYGVSTIMLKNYYVDETKDSDDRYYFEINSSDIEGGFQVDQYYKVQFRFTSTSASTYDPSSQKLEAWLAANLDRFSEWSTVCLIRGISKPSVSITGLSNTASYSVWNSTNADIVGEIEFVDENEDEAIQSYRIQFYDESDEIVVDSGIIYSSYYNKNRNINYIIKGNLVEGNSYTLKVSYITLNLYEGEQTYNVQFSKTIADEFDATITAAISHEDAVAIIHIKGDTTNFSDNIIISRTSNESNFTYWEDIYSKMISDEDGLNYYHYDYTIESGVWYKYRVQKRINEYTRSEAVVTSTPIMDIFDFLYLKDDGDQIKIKYNPSISSFKRNISESKIDTIGSKYPFIKRNGDVDYKTFPITGLISVNAAIESEDIENYYSDDIDIRTELLKEIDLYNNYNAENRVTLLNDYTLERKFREKIMNLLYNDKVKLFRSAAEGNVLVKLMDINFTPESQLGGYIYNFSCTAYEIDECTIDNYIKYGIQEEGTYETSYYQKHLLGELGEDNDPISVISAGTNLMSLLDTKYSQYSKEGYIMTIQDFDGLRIEFLDDSYPIVINSDGELVPKTSDSTEEVAFFGHILTIDGQDIVISDGNVYEIDDKINISSLTFPVDTQARIDYQIDLYYLDEQSKNVTTTNYYTIIGQFFGGFSSTLGLRTLLRRKYEVEYSLYTQEICQINSVSIEAEPGTVVYVQEVGSTYYKRYVIGETCLLSLDEEDVYIKDLHLYGMHYYKQGEKISNEFLEWIDKTDAVYDSYEAMIAAVKSPNRYEVYAAIVGEKINRYLWDGDNWMEFTEEDDVPREMSAIINYNIEVKRGADL